MNTLQKILIVALVINSTLDILNMRSNHKLALTIAYYNEKNKKLEEIVLKFIDFVKN